MENNFDEIKKLKELLDSGAITQEEFEQQKCKLLNTPPVVQAQPPVYQTPVQNFQPQVPVKKKNTNGCLIAFLIVLFAFVGFIIFVVVLANAFGDSNSSNNRQNVTQSTIAEDKTEKVEETEEVKETKKTNSRIAVGKVANNEKFEITINGSSEESKINSDDDGYFFYEAEEDTKYIVVEFTIKNVYDNLENFSNSDFQMFSNDGKQYSPSSLIITGDKNFFTYESLNPGTKKQGYIAYNIPKDISINDLYIVYHKSFSSDTIEFNIK